MKGSLEIGTRFTGMAFTKNHHEMIPHGSPQFHMSVHLTRVPSGSSQVLYTHWHDELEFLFFTKGKARVQIDTETFTVKDHDLLVIPPNMLHSADRIDKSPSEFLAILVHFDFLSSMENDDLQRKYILPIFFRHIPYPLHVTAEMDAKYHLFEVLWSIVHAYQHEERGYELLIKSKLYETFYILVKYSALFPSNAAISSNNLTNYNWTKSFLLYIQENFHRRISLADMAQQANMSEGHFSRTVKRVFGSTPMEFLTNYRLSQAVHLIETTGWNLGDIADETGFSNINRFTENFKKAFNCTPLKYRNNLKQESNNIRP